MLGTKEMYELSAPQKFMAALSQCGVINQPGWRLWDPLSTRTGFAHRGANAAGTNCDTSEKLLAQFLQQELGFLSKESR